MILKASFWKKLPGILKKILAVLAVVDPTSIAAAERRSVATHVASLTSVTGPVPLVVSSHAPLSGLTEDDVRLSLAKISGAILGSWGLVVVAAGFIHGIHVPPEATISDFFKAVGDAAHSAFALKDALVHVLEGFGIVGLRRAMPGGQAPKSITVETFQS